MKDALDQWWNGPKSHFRTWLQYPPSVMALSPEDRCDRAKVNEAVRRYLTRPARAERRRDTIPAARRDRSK